MPLQFLFTPGFRFLEKFAGIEWKFGDLKSSRSFEWARCTTQLAIRNFHKSTSHHVNPLKSSYNTRTQPPKHNFLFVFYVLKEVLEIEKLFTRSALEIIKV